MKYEQLDNREKIQKTYGQKVWKELNDPELRKIGKRKEKRQRIRYEDLIHSDIYQDNEQ